MAAPDLSRRVSPGPLRADLHWDLEALEPALQDAKLFVFCNPANPAGVVHTAEELTFVAGALTGTSTLVLADEACSALVYSDRPFPSALDVPALADRLLYCQTLSKAHAMTGWRIGYLAGSLEAIAAAARVHSSLVFSVNSAVQRTALTAVTSSSDTIATMRKQYRHRRDLMVAGLAAIDGLHLIEPGGAFYAFPRDTTRN